MTHEANQTRDELLESISELFLTYGLRSTSMDDMCMHLKISKKTLYQIFENKDDVVEQVMSYRLEKCRRETSLDKLLEHNPVQFICDIKKHILVDLASQLPANYFDVKKYHPAVDEKIKGREHEFLSMIMDAVLAGGIKDGYFRNDINMRMQTYLFSKQMEFLKETEMVNSEELEYPVPVLISTIVDNFILTIVTKKGWNEFERIRIDQENSERRNKIK